MAGFAHWVARHRLPRVACIAGLFPLWVLSLFSAALVAMTAQLKGGRVAAEDAAMAGVLLLAVSLAAGGDWPPVLGSAAASWGLAGLLGGLTGRYASVTLAVQVLLVLVCAAVLAFTLAVGDTTAWWTRVLAQLAGEMRGLGVELGDDAVLAPLAPLMTGLVAASAVSSSVLALVLGAWWAGAVGGPPVGEMFGRLRLGRALGIAMAVVAVLGAGGVGGLAGGLLMVLGTGFAVQGLAVLHWQARARRWPPGAVLLVYLPLLLGPSLAAIAWFLLAAVGFVDNWYSLRRHGGDVI